MKKIDITPIVSGVSMPFKKGTMKHLQESYQEAIAAIARINMMGYVAGYESFVFILYGCKNTGTGTSYIISSGAVYYNGEVFLVDAATFTTATGEVAIGEIVTTNYTDITADPVEYSDGTTANVHQIRKVRFKSGPSDATWNYSTMTRIDTMGSKILVGSSGAATFENSWVAESGGVFTAPFYRINYQTKQVFIGGHCEKSNISATDETIFTLPTGYRPLKKEMFECHVKGSGSSPITMVEIHVLSNGQVRTIGNGSAITGGVIISLNNINFFYD